LTYEIKTVPELANLKYLDLLTAKINYRTGYENSDRFILGQKTGAGWYRYDENRKASPDPEVESLIRETAQAAGIPQRTISSEEILERCLYVMINEGARILEEGYALRAADIDTIYLSGYGFPGYRGGPMWYADTVGLKKILQRIQEFQHGHGELWEPAPLLRRLAEQGGTFAKWDAEQETRFALP
jgi:3-hydroxyacyl-CoA dehydrogenase